MNLILFEPEETAQPLPRSDPRALHVLNVLRREVGDSFDVGLVDGPRGKAMLVEIGRDTLKLSFSWGVPPPPLDPITLIVGLPRPQTARKILQDATALGVSSVHFVRTDRAEPSYGQSTLWNSGEWRRHLIAGAEQAFCTRLPAVTWNRTLADTLALLSHEAGRVALDNYEGTMPLLQYSVSGYNPSNPPEVALAVGSERGWSAEERHALRQQGFALAHLGTRVLRTETAIVAALAILKAKLGQI
ncbi:16S rRNA methyltransferase [Opitutaceae bacterium EW11]|nr:16S rRNA methyltransferase [Opitutaceae bacterium EW11]